MSLAGVNEHEITYFIKEPPGKIIVDQKNAPKSGKSTASASTPASQVSSGGGGVGGGKNLYDKESLLLHISSLETQIAEQTKLSREQTDVLLEDRKTRAEEYETQRVKDAHTIKQLKDKLFKTQQLLHESTKDFLELKFAARQNERRWMHEKDKLLQDLDKSAKHEMIKEDEVRCCDQK